MRWKKENIDVKLLFIVIGFIFWSIFSIKVISENLPFHPDDENTTKKKLKTKRRKTIRKWRKNVTRIHRRKK